MKRGDVNTSSKHHKSISIRNDILEEVQELVDLKPDGYKYETKTGFITDAINHHIRRVKNSMKADSIDPDTFMELLGTLVNK